MKRYSNIKTSRHCNVKIAVFIKLLNNIIRGFNEYSHLVTAEDYPFDPSETKEHKVE